MRNTHQYPVTLEEKQKLLQTLIDEHFARDPTPGDMRGAILREIAKDVEKAAA